MKKIILLGVLLLIAFSLVSCDSSDSVDSSYNYTFNSANGGNWSFIDLNDVAGSPSDNVELIASSITKWENLNPARLIVSIQIFHETYNYIEYIDGISIYSKLK